MLIQSLFALQVRHQAILSLTHEEWTDLIQLFQIKKPMIKHDMEALRYSKGQNKKARR